VPQVGRGSHNPIVTPARVFAGQANHQILDFCTEARSTGRAAVFRAIELCATSWRYQPRMVSGLARRANCGSPLRPERWPISARVDRSPSDSREFRGEMCLQNPALGCQIRRSRAARM
jgi:hypothetical protein